MQFYMIQYQIKYNLILYLMILYKIIVYHVMIHNIISNHLIPYHIILFNTALFNMIQNGFVYYDRFMINIVSYDIIYIFNLIRYNSVFCSVIYNCNTI